MREEQCCENPKIVQRLSGYEYTVYGECTDNFVETVECANCGHIIHNEKEEMKRQLKTIPY